MRQRAVFVPLFAVVLALVVVAVACGDDTEPTATEPSVTEPAATEPVSSGIAADRCQANQEAGTINYYSGFDYAAAASIIEVIVADDAGYYDELCLDVEITPSFSTANYPLVASNQAQFSSSGSFSELVTFASGNEADLVALSVDGHVAIDLLMVHPDLVASLADIAGTTLGVKGALPPAVAVMLRFVPVRPTQWAAVSTTRVVIMAPPQPIERRTTHGNSPWAARSPPTTCCTGASGSGPVRAWAGSDTPARASAAAAATTPTRLIQV